METLISQSAFIFYGIAIMAVISHGIVKWARGNVRGSVTNWFIMNPKATVLSFGTALAGTVAALLSFDVVDINSGAQILAIWGLGYSSDSIFNSQGKK